MLDLHFLKQLALAATWTGHPEDTGESAHGAILRKAEGRELNVAPGRTN